MSALERIRYHSFRARILSGSNQSFASRPGSRKARKEMMPVATQRAMVNGSFMIANDKAERPPPSSAVVRLTTIIARVSVLCHGRSLPEKGLLREQKKLAPLGESPCKVQGLVATCRACNWFDFAASGRKLTLNLN